eukprot:8529859-Lingulodinium_polyedra.AAC.1
MTPAEAQTALPCSPRPLPVKTAGAKPTYQPWASACLAAPMHFASRSLCSWPKKTIGCRVW